MERTEGKEGRRGEFCRLRTCGGEGTPRVRDSTLRVHSFVIITPCFYLPLSFSPLCANSMFLTSTRHCGRALGRRFAGMRGLSSKVGFIGLGNMGGHMAANLLKAGHDVVVFDVAQAAIEQATSAGATAAATPREIAEQADVIVTMLPSNPHVVAVYTDPDSGILASVQKNALLIDSSTIDPNVSRQVAAEVQKAGAVMVDAPVSGGVGGAEAGTLTFMVGGTDDAFRRAEAILKHMGSNIVHCGDIGTGEVAKLCNNLVLGISMAGVCEAMNLGQKLGIDSKKLADIMNTSTARCWSSDTYNPCPGVMENVPASNGYKGGFGSALMQKDLGLVMDAGKAAGAPLPMGGSAHQLYSLMSAHGAGQKDFGALFEFLSGDHMK